MFKKDTLNKDESKETIAKKSDGKKVLIFLSSVMIIAILLAMCSKDDTQKIDGDFNNAEIVEVMNGSNTNSIGKTSIIKCKSSDVTDEYLLDWNKNHIQANDFNWAVIVYTDKGNDDLGVYSTGNLIFKNIGLEKKDDGSYMQAGNREDTIMYTVDGDNLIKEDIGAEDDAISTDETPALSSTSSISSDKEEENIDATKIVAKTLIEETIEKQRMKGFAPSAYFSVVRYSNNPIKDQDGNEYPISYMVSGEYEEKGSGAIREFLMCIAYRSQTDVDNFNGYCLQYVNADTNKYFNIVAKEYDVLEKLYELTN